MKHALEGVFTKQDPHRRPWRNVSIRDIVISSTVRPIDHCSASALLSPPSRARRWRFFFFFNRWQNSQHDGFAFRSFLSVFLCLRSLFLSYYLPFLFSVSWKRREIKESEGKGLVHMSDRLCSLSPFISLVWGLWLWNSLSLSRAGQLFKSCKPTLCVEMTLHWWH